jgi:hypothetical protein
MRIIYIPDTQVKPDVPLAQLLWAGRYIKEQQPDLVIHAGDHYDLPSLSSYDRGTRHAEGRRLHHDLAAGELGLEMLRIGMDGFKPPQGKLITKGNHENRLDRHIDAHPYLLGTLSDESFKFEQYGWQLVPFLEPTWVEGIQFCHYFCRNARGMVVQSRRGMPSASAQVIREGCSSISGHQQGLQVHVQTYQDRQQWGIIAGSYYLHDEAYLTPQGSKHWHGLVVLNSVKNGDFSPWFVDSDYLCRRYTGVGVQEFLRDATDLELLRADVS